MLIGKHNPRAAVSQTKLKGLYAKEHRHRHGHRGHLGDRYVGHCGFKPLRHHDGHPIAALHTETL